MKSLESLEIINICLKELDYEHKEDTNIWRYDLEVIKQDLEVLEIIKNNKVDVWALLHILRNWKKEPDYMIKAVYNDRCWGEQCTLSNEEINKLKQWLEVN